MKAHYLLNPVYVAQRRDRIGPYLQRTLNRLNLPVTANDRRLKRLKNAHRGQRGFIIGAGPSLRISDLELLKQEITFGCNKIYLAFDQTAWRPTYYSVLDVILAKQNFQQIQQLDLPKIFSCWVKPYFAEAQDITWLRHLAHPVENGAHFPQFSTNALAGVYGGWTVIYTQLQLAFYMGFQEIYLLGVDFSFSIPPASGQTSAHGAVIEHQGEINHFHPNYRRPGEQWTAPQLDLQRQAFNCARQAFAAHGRAVYNASRQTALDVFPRCDFDELMAG